MTAKQAGEAHQPVRDLDQIRAFLTSTGPIAIVDLPWMPAFLAICFLIHPWLGALSLAGGALLIVVTVLTARAGKEPGLVVARDAGARTAIIEALRRNSETAVAMGMTGALARRWESANRNFLSALRRASDATNTYGSITKVLRLGRVDRSDPDADAGEQHEGGERRAFGRKNAGQAGAK